MKKYIIITSMHSNLRIPTLSSRVIGGLIIIQNHCAKNNLKKMLQKPHRKYVVTIVKMSDQGCVI